MGFKAHTNLALGVGSDREACVGVNVLFGEVDVSLGCGVDLDALAGAGTDVGGDDGEGVWIACVPYALFGLELAGGRANLRGGKQQEDQEEGGGTWMVCFKWCQ